MEKFSHIQITGIRCIQEWVAICFMVRQLKWFEYGVFVEVWEMLMHLLPKLLWFCVFFIWLRTIRNT